MKKLQIKQLNDKDEGIVEALISLGMNRPIARVVTYLKQVNEATSHELELGTDLGQPEVSVAMKQLKDRDWITEREEKKPGKGRPYRIYKLQVPFNEIVAQLEEQKKKAALEMQERIKRLKELGR